MYLIIAADQDTTVTVIKYMVYVDFSSLPQPRPTLCDPMDCSTPGFPDHHQLLELAQTHVLQVGDAIQLSHPLLFSLLLPSIFPRIRDFSNEKVLHIRWPKDWSLNFSISPSNDYSGLISFRMDWLDLFVVQGTLKSILQHKRSKASILWRSAFFMIQPSRPYMTTGKTIVLTGWTFVGKVMSLLFNMLSRLVIHFLPRINHLLNSWLQSPSAVILEPKKRKSSIVSISHEVMGSDATILVFWMLNFQFSSVQLLSHVWFFATPWIAARQASLSITNSQSSLKLMSIESVMPSSHLIFCHPLLLLPPIAPSIRVFSNESTLCMRWPCQLMHHSFQRTPRTDLL